MNFEQSVKQIIKLEGGYVFDKNDPGGETKYGISKRSFPEVNIKDLTMGHAEFLYEKNYWIKLKCDGMPPSLRLIIFDCGVNQGVNFAAKSLQASIGAKADGIIGNKTLDKAIETDEIITLDKFIHLRMERYFRNKNFDRYGKGWIARLLYVSVRTQRP